MPNSPSEKFTRKQHAEVSSPNIPNALARPDRVFDEEAFDGAPNNPDLCVGREPKIFYMPSRHYAHFDSTSPNFKGGLGKPILNQFTPYRTMIVLEIILVLVILGIITGSGAIVGTRSRDPNIALNVVATAFQGLSCLLTLETWLWRVFGRI